MKSHIGLEHIRSQSEGRITHVVTDSPGEPPPQAAGEKAVTPSDLVPVVVHVEKSALDDLLHKASR